MKPWFKIMKNSDYHDNIYINMLSELEKSIDKLKNGELLKEKEVKSLCARVREIFVEEGNVQRIDAPVTVNI